MANLETLELTINANAESASKGLASLIGSLSALGGQVNRNVGALKNLNAELSKLKGIGSIKMPEFGQAVRSSSAAKRVHDTTTAMQQQIEAITGMSKATKSAKDSAIWMDKLMGKQALDNRGKAVADTVKEQIKEQQDQIIPPSTPYTKYGMTAERWGSMSQAEQKTFEKQIRLQYRMQQEAQNTKRVMEETAPAINEVKTATADLTKTEEEVAPAMEDNGVKQKSFRQGFRDLAKDISNSIPKFKMLHRVLRIGTTMLIRMGIRGLFKGVKEGLGNYYQYAKATGGEFTREIDGLTSAWTQLKNQMGAAIAPAIGAVIPILNGIASAAIGAFNALSQLFALLGGKGVWSKATAQVTAFDAAAQKAGGGGGGLKEMLAKFDELNVIAQEGGGGGGGGTSAEEFASMFEDMYEFDERIRNIANFIRDTVQWVKDNMDVVYQSVIAIGMAILGWKMSKAFEGALGEFGKILAGSALITLGVILDFDFGKKLGSGATLSWLDLLEGIGGVIAAGIGGYLVAGTTGLVIGIGISLLATIIGVTIGASKRAEAIKWGTTTLTPEQVKSYVQSQFKFDVEAEISIVGGKLKNLRAAKAHLSEDIEEFSSSLSKIQLNVDDSEGAVESAKTKLGNVIEQLKKYTESGEALLTAYIEFLPYTEEEKNGLKTDIFGANKVLNQYFENMGKKAADLYDKGMRDGWKGNEKQQILALMDHIESIFSAAENNRVASKTKNKLKLTMSGMTKETAQAVLAEQKRLLTEYRTTMEESMLEQVSQLEYFATLAEEAGLMDPKTGRKLADVYREKARFIVDSFESEMNLKLGSVKEEMKAEWTKTLKEIYGDSFSASVSDLANTTKFRNAVMKGSAEAAELLKKELDLAISRNPLLKEAADLFGINGWDLLADKTKAKYISTFMKAFGNDAIAELKNKLNVPVDDIIKFSGYDKMATKAKLEFVNAVMSAFGASAALDAARKAGIDVVAAYNAGLNSGDSSTVAAAKKLAEQIDAELKKLNIKVPVGADLKVKIQTLLELTTKVKMEVIKKAATQSIAVGTGGVAGSMLTNIGDIIKPHANGAYGIPNGDLFIANEQGAELVGSIGGKTSVANQGQIIEGIQRGVAEANESQNALLRQQNELLRGILEKETNVNFGASASFGRTVRQSLDMYNGMTGSR